MGISTTEMALVQRAFEVARERSLIISSCHPRRSDPPYVTLKTLLPQLIEEMGAVVSFRLDFSYHRPTKAQLHLGLLMDHVNHEVDLLSFLFGPQTMKATRLFDDQVRYEVVGMRDDGISFVFSGTRMLDKTIYPEFVSIRFQRGEISVDTFTGRIRIYPHEDKPRRHTSLQRTNYERRCKAVNHNFVNTVLRTALSYLSQVEMMQNTHSGIALTEAGFFCG